ncbi:hypothetical protein [Pseudomonas tremae]|uniref:hypothetical protein n=1 Tax=Pseudomonas tremae TaxID=200454 RepID=UPI001F361F36|nr:hypothetical protein [Pseudomonas tremae]MCF5747102.1 hypothetical protein [Pseudomonas tremae]UQB36588.1 hypothetical protein I9H09_24380 [Pseudomonas tremae]
MSTDFFKASVQYGDYKGSVAADDHDSYTIDHYMVSQGLKTSDDRIVGIKMWSGEVHGNLQNQPVGITAYLIESPGFDEVSTAINGPDPIPVKQVSFDVSLEQFFGLFKRFEIAITRFEELNGRELLITD